MNRQFQTDQELFWAGKFGDEYITRNAGESLIGSNVALFAKALARCSAVSSLIEFGANIGLNLRAIQHLLPSIELDAIEINAQAVELLRRWDGIRTVHHDSILGFRADRTWDIALIKGVLIHIDPDHLTQAYDSLFNASSRYILIAEYYNPTPLEVPYRGHAGRLFKRDFAGEMLERHPALRVVDYGFVWRSDPQFPQDDTTWFLLEKSCAPG